MSLLDRLESRFRRFAVSNLTGMIILAQVFFLFVFFVRLQQNPALDPLEPFRLNLDLVAQGQAWRLFTFLVLPPVSPVLDWRIIFVIFYWMLLYTFGTALEHEWGVVRYNLYLWIGYLATLAGALVLWLLWGFSGGLSNGFLYGSLFLAFARYYPDFTISLYFILPVKIKWLAYLQWAWYAFLVTFGGAPTRVFVLASVLNYLIYFGKEHYRQSRQRHRSHEFKVKAKAASGKIVHECRVCGVTSQMQPKMLFRYCTQCEGQCCYCPEHINNHEHVGAAKEAEATE